MLNRMKFSAKNPVKFYLSEHEKAISLLHCIFPLPCHFMSDFLETLKKYEGKNRNFRKNFS